MAVARPEVEGREGEGREGETIRRVVSLTMLRGGWWLAGFSTMPRMARERIGIWCSGTNEVWC